MRIQNPFLNFNRKKILSQELTKSGDIELLIKTSKDNQHWLANELGRVGKILHVYDSIPYVSLTCDTSDAQALNESLNNLYGSKALRSISKVVSSIDLSGSISIPPVEESDGAGVWNLQDVGAYEAQKIALGSNVNIAIIDTGVDYRHHEISSCYRGGFDFVRNTKEPMDFNGHGTHVAGIAVGNNYGIAQDANLYSLRVLDENGLGNESNTIAALDWAAKNKIDVINLSLGSPYASTALEEICYYLANNGVLIIAAAGNDGYGPNYPAAFADPVIAVAAVDRNNRHAEFSNIYETNDISAPGVSITSSYLGGYKTLSGTSMAAPHVAGGMALILSALRQEYDLEQVMQQTAQNLGKMPQVYGAGLLRIDLMATFVTNALKKQGLRDYGREVLSVFKEALWED